jgi:hypothetical protein
MSLPKLRPPPLWPSQYDGHLLEEVNVSALNLHTVEASVSRDLCGMSEIFNSLF